MIDTSEITEKNVKAKIKHLVKYNQSLSAIDFPKGNE